MLSRDQSCDDAIQWFWLSKVREECPSYWCLVDPTTGYIVSSPTTDGTTSSNTTTTMTATNPTTTTPSPTANDVLASSVTLIQSHWDTWTPERLTSTLAGKVVVVGVKRSTAEVLCMGVLDIPVRFQYEGQTSTLLPTTTTTTSSHVLQLTTATFVIVAPTARGLGLGRKLMTKLEEACGKSHLPPPAQSITSAEEGASSNGVAVLRAVLGNRVDGISLRTDTQVAFYEACGYRRGRTQQLISERACFQKANLKQNQLDGLASLFAARGVEAQRRIATASAEGGDTKKAPQPEDHSSKSTPTATTVQSTPTANNNNSVWMLKVVREEAPEPFTRPLLPATIPLPTPTDKDEPLSSSPPSKGFNLVITDAANDALSSNNNDTINLPQPLSLGLVLPWQRQIGPSCGLALLRMMREFIMDEYHLLHIQPSFPSSHSNNTTTTTPTSRASILASLPSLSDLYLSISSSTPDYYVEFMANTTDGDDDARMRSKRQPPALGEVLHVGLLKCVGEKYLQSLLTTTIRSSSTPPPPPPWLLFEVVPIETLLQANTITSDGGKEGASSVWYAVPYDRSSSEAPSTTQGGQRAHWGMVVGGIANTHNNMVLLQHGASPDVVLTTVDELISSNQHLQQVAVTCQESGETRQASLSGLRGSCVRISIHRSSN